MLYDVTSSYLGGGGCPPGPDRIAALRAPAIKERAAEGGPPRPSQSDDRDLAEIASPVDPLRGSPPGERLVICENPLLAEERARKREGLQNIHLPS